MSGTTIGELALAPNARGVYLESIQRVARYVFKLSPLMVLGGLAGAQTCTPGLTALRDASDSNIGSLAYTVPYAIGNILLTIWGPVVVAIVHAMR